MPQSKKESGESPTSSAAEKILAGIAATAAPVDAELAERVARSEANGVNNFTKLGDILPIEGLPELMTESQEVAGPEVGPVPDPPKGRKPRKQTIWGNGSRVSIRRDGHKDFDLGGFVVDTRPSLESGNPPKTARVAGDDGFLHVVPIANLRLVL